MNITVSEGRCCAAELAEPRQEQTAELAMQGAAPDKHRARLLLNASRW